MADSRSEGEIVVEVRMAPRKVFQPFATGGEWKSALSRGRRPPEPRRSRTRWIMAASSGSVKRSGLVM